MKKLLLLIFLFGSLMSSAQNYQCLQNGVLHYFINGNGYLRAIKIDSVTTLPDTSIFYPCHTPRGPYIISTPYIAQDTFGGSWVGGKVFGLADGTFIFDSYWSNSVTIKSRAATGATWLFYSDSSTRYYQAQMLNTDTMSVLGFLDSVKRILITAHDPSGLVVSDPLDSFQIILSKNHGFVQVFDLYTFPYHKPDSVYRSGLDFFLDRSTHTYYDVNSFGGNAPNKSISIFNLTDFINPNDQQLHTWNVGDIFEVENETGTTSPYPPYIVDYTLDTVVNKVVLPHSTIYSIRGSSFNYTIPVYETFHAGNITYTDGNFIIADSNVIPESKISFYNNNYVFYFPKDTSWCRQGPVYQVVWPAYSWGELGGSFWNDVYKLGIGLIHHYYIDGNPTYESDRLIYCKMAGEECGHNIWPVGIDHITNDQVIQLFPNPVLNNLTIVAPIDISSVSISDAIGHEIRNEKCNTHSIILDLSNIPTGLYFARINGVIVKNFIKQ